MAQLTPPPLLPLFYYFSGKLTFCKANCEAIDNCYQDCVLSYDHCNKDFYHGMRKVCHNLYPWGHKLFKRIGCEIAASIYFAATYTFGALEFTEATEDL